MKSQNTTIINEEKIFHKQIKILTKKIIFFHHFCPFLVPNGPPLALPRSVLTPSICPRSDLNRPIPENDDFDVCFFFTKNKVLFLDPFGPSFTPLEVKIWPRDYHRKIGLDVLPPIRINLVSIRHQGPKLWSKTLSFSYLILALSSRWPRPLWDLGYVKDPGSKKIDLYYKTLFWISFD